MELSQLYQFIAVAEYSNITTAANKLYMTQSSLSRTIISMEQELGCDLLVRSRKGVSLTPAGELLLQSANKIVAEIEQVSTEIAMLTQNRTPAIKVCSEEGVLFRSLMPPFLRSNPDFPEVETEIVKSTDILQKVRNGYVAITYQQIRDHDIVSEFIMQDCILISVPKRHHLANKKNISLMDINGETFYKLRDDSYSTRMFYRLLQHNGINVNYEYQNDYYFLAELIKNGDHLAFISLLSTLFIDLGNKRVNLLLNDPDATDPVYVVYHKNDAEKIRPFVQWWKENQANWFNRIN